MGDPTGVRAVVACFGNVLRGDDGFGGAVAEELERAGGPPDDVRVIEIGIGGIHLVYELADAVEVLVVVDALDLDREPGQVLVVRPDVLDVDTLAPDARRDQLADVHYAVPERALMLAGALGRLPEETWLIGCQVGETDELGQGLSPAVERAVVPAAREVRRLLEDHGVAWSRDARGDATPLGDGRSVRWRDGEAGERDG
jgi:hydrogenase maturation protease